MAEHPNNGTARWANLAAVAGLGIVVFGSIATLYMRADGAFSKATALEVRIANVEDRNRIDESKIKVLHARLEESYTQLRASIDDRNIIHASDMRIQAMLWEQAFHGKSHYPTDNAYYPNIADGKSQ